MKLPTNTNSGHTHVALLVSVWILPRLYIALQVLLSETQLIPLKDWGFWYFPLNYIEGNFFNSMLYLRSIPPVPQLILGISIKVFGMGNFQYAIFVLLSVLSLFQALMIRSILLSLRINVYVATLTAALFLSVIEKIVMEYGAQQDFYDSITAFLFTLSVWLMTKKFHMSIAVISLGLLIMTRGTLSYFPVFWIVTAALINNIKILKIFILVLTIQMTWSIKNFIVFGESTFETSSFSGMTILDKVANTGYQKNWDDFIYANSNLYKKTSCNLQNGGWWETISSCFPEEHIKDIELNKKLGCNLSVAKEEPCSLSNSYRVFAYSKELKSAYLDWIKTNPLAVIHGFYTSYNLFWDEIHGCDEAKSLVENPVTSSLLTLSCSIQKSSHILFKIFFIFITIPFSILIPIFIAKKNRVSKSEIENHMQFIPIFTSLSICYYVAATSIAACCENARYATAILPLLWLMPFMPYAYWRANKS